MKPRMNLMLLIDPYIFLPGKTGKFDTKKICEIKLILKTIIFICKQKNWKIICDRDGFNYIEMNIIKNITKDFSDPELATALLIMRRDCINTVHIDDAQRVRTWGIKPLFNNLVSESDKLLADFVTKSALACLNKGAQAYFFVHESVGRNIDLHRAGNSIILERTRWRIYLSAQGLPGIMPIPCIYHQRNLDVEWTTRYDIKLPDSGDFPFIPLGKWHLRKTIAVGTKTSKPVFIDQDGNGWADPNIPGDSYHWDVYLKNTAWIAATKKVQINISRHGIPSVQGKPGTIHH
jgi:hypothetical protein